MWVHDFRKLAWGMCLQTVMSAIMQKKYIISFTLMRCHGDDNMSVITTLAHYMVPIKMNNYKKFSTMVLHRSPKKCQERWDLNVQIKV